MEKNSSQKSGKTQVKKPKNWKNRKIRKIDVDFQIFSKTFLFFRKDYAYVPSDEIKKSIRKSEKKGENPKKPKKFLTEGFRENGENTHKKSEF